MQKVDTSLEVIRGADGWRLVGECMRRFRRGGGGETDRSIEVEAAV